MAGAVIGGVGASLAVSSDSETELPRVLPQVEIASFNKNYVDKVGKLHNRIIFNYSKKHKNYSPETYFNFIQENKSEYGFEEIPITLEFLQNQQRMVKEFDDIESINRYIINNLPESVDKNSYSNFLSKLMNTKSKDRTLIMVKDFEDKELSNEDYDLRTKAVLGSFFSTFRHSLVLWNN